MIRIGLAQMDIVWEDIEKNKKKVVDFLEKAKKEKLDWIVFPEMTMTGFSMNTEMAIYYDDVNLFFQEMAIKYSMGIIYGVIARGQGDKFENHMIFVDENGKKTMEYAKIHPFSYGAEAKYYTGGDKVWITSWKNATFGGFICYDLRFPNIFQTVSEATQVIFVIANWPMERVDQWDTLLSARAIENACYVVGVNRSGRAGRLLYTGHSAVYDYCGHRLTEICEQEELILAEIDETSVADYRAGFPMIADRKPELYKKLKAEIYPD